MLHLMSTHSPQAWFLDLLFGQNTSLLSHSRLFCPPVRLLWGFEDCSVYSLFWWVWWFLVRFSVGIWVYISLSDLVVSSWKAFSGGSMLFGFWCDHSASFHLVRFLSRFSILLWSGYKVWPRQVTAFWYYFFASAYVWSYLLVFSLPLVTILCIKWYQLSSSWIQVAIWCFAAVLNR